MLPSLMRANSVVLLLSFTALAQAQDWTWRATALLGQARSEACLQRLPDGRILAIGGLGPDPLDSVELFSTQPTESFRNVAPLPAPRAGHGCTTLDDGRVLVAGGGARGIALYEPTWDSWTSIESPVERAGGTVALRLPDGRILIAGGGSTALETFDANSGEITSLPSTLLFRREKFTATLLADGRVLIIGGLEGQTTLNSTEIFDPATDTVQAGPPLTGPRAAHSATRLLDGRVLLAGGSNGSADLRSLELFDPESATFKMLPATLNQARQGHANLLFDANGTVLLAGGLADGIPLSTTELFDPADNQVREAGALTAARTAIAAILLEDGSVLATGGRGPDGPSRACGVLSAPSLVFSQPVYRPLEQAVVSAVFQTAVANNTRVTFTLSRINPVNGAQTRVDSRLLTNSALIANSRIAATRIMNVFREDIGHEFVLTASAPVAGGVQISVQARFAAKLATTLTVAPTAGITIFGQPVLVNVRLTADGNPVPFSGPLTVTVGTLTKTVQLTGTAPTLAINVPVCCHPAAESVVAISASYAGDASLQSSRPLTSPNHLIVSKTPAIAINVPGLSLGAPASISASLVAQGTTNPFQPVDGSLRPTGSVTFRLNSGPIGTAPLQPVAGLSSSPLPFAVAQFAYTPTVLDRRSRTGLCFEAAYSGDTRYLPTDTAPPPTSGIFVSRPCFPVAAAVSRLAVVAAPTTYTLGTRTNVSVRLTWPDSVGLLSRLVEVAADGRPVGQITLSPDLNGRGIADGTADLTLPFDAKIITFSYAASGDLANSQAAVSIAMNRLASVTTTTLRNPVVNPFSIPFSLTVNTGSVPLPPNTPLGGSIEFLDGQTLIGTIPLPTVPRSGAGITDGSSNTILIPEFGLSGFLTGVIRPTGARNITIRYTGSPLVLPSQVQVTVTVP